MVTAIKRGGKTMLLHDNFDYHARKNASAEFAVQGTRRITYAEAGAEANRLANAFIDSGVKEF